MFENKVESIWKEKLIEWKSSGKGVRAWCFENQIPVTTFYGWKKRLEKEICHKDQTTLTRYTQQLKTPQKFIELKDIKPLAHPSDSGIVLECKGIKIHLLRQFDPQTLKQCVICLEGALC